jgi:hypothetical protein
VSGPLRDARDARFELVSGTTTVRVRLADLHGDRYRVSTPERGGSVPVVTDRDDLVQLRLDGGGGAGVSTVDITLSSAVRWSVRLVGGAADVSLDLRGGPVSTVDFPSGMDTVELNLPRPRGTVPVRVGGGANRFTLHAPAGVPVRVLAGGGAGSVTVDGQVHTGVAGGTVFAPSTWDSTADRYDLDTTSGVATIVVDRR